MRYFKIKFRIDQCLNASYSLGTTARFDGVFIDHKERTYNEHIQKEVPK